MATNLSDYHEKWVTSRHRCHSSLVILTVSTIALLGFNGQVTGHTTAQDSNQYVELGVSAKQCTASESDSESHSFPQ